MDIKKELRERASEELRSMIAQVQGKADSVAKASGTVTAPQLLRLALGGKDASLRKKVITSIVKAKEEQMYRQFFANKVDGEPEATYEDKTVKTPKKVASK